jgi:regulator of protease activity HflC (stomatin/prohibitin superfamily)
MLGRPSGQSGGEEVGGRHFGAPRIPKRLILLGGFVVVVLLLPWLFIKSIFAYVAPNEYGIKEVKVGVNRGIHTQVYTAGYWFIKPFGLEKMHRFPRQLQVLELTTTEKPSKNSASHAYDRAAKIQTSDGFFVDLDVTILYSIVDPYKVMTTLGPGLLYLTNGIEPKAEPMLKQALGELNVEDFYNSTKRVEKTDKAKAALDTELSPKGMRVDQVLVRYFKYSDEIQKNIELKKLQDQLVFKNQAEGKANTEEAATKKARQEGEMKVKITLQEGEAYKTEKTAETDLFTRKRGAEAKLLVKTAEAEAMQLKNEAMQLLGYDRKVAIEMAKLMEGIECLVIPTGGPQGVNPLDLQSMLKLFGVQSGGPAGVVAPKKTEAPPPITPHEPPPPAPNAASPPVAAPPPAPPAPLLETAPAKEGPK